MWKLLFAWLLFRHQTEKTNATFFRRATKQRRETDQRPSAWHWLPGWQRLAWKVGSALLTLALLWLLLVDPVELLALICLAVAAGITAGVVRTVEWWKTRKHTRAVVTPLHDALTDVLGDAA